MKKISGRNLFRLIGFSAVTLFFIFQWMSYRSHDEAKSLMEEDSAIRVQENSDKIRFITESDSTLEILFFPGGLIDPFFYVPLARALAESGYTLHINKMPWRMSTWGYTKIKERFDLHGVEKQFVLGDHSQRAKMAA